MNPVILCVDDSPTQRMSLKLALKKAGYEVETAENGIEGVNKAFEVMPHVIVSDIVMPERDGLEVIMFLRRQQPHVKVIAVSAPGNELFLTSAKGLGAARVFQKPFELGDIASAAEELLLESQPDRCSPPIAQE